MIMNLATAARIGAACAVLMCASCTDRVQAEAYTKAYQLTGRANVRVNAQWGAVRVITNDGNKVEFDVEYDRQEWASALPIESRQDGNAVTLTARVDEHSWWGWGTFGDHRLDITIRMPRDADLQLTTTNGDIDVSSVNGKVAIHTQNGKIDAQHLVGTLDIGSSNGAITLDTLQGAMTVYTTNGSITASRLDGKCEVSTTNGLVRIEGRFESLDITSTNGSVFTRAEEGSRMASDWRIETTNGGVDMSVPKDLAANLDVNTHNGSIKLDLPVTVQGEAGGNSVRGILNGGGPEMSLRTTNASIRVRGI
jgi:Putative adhesin